LQEDLLYLAIVNVSLLRTAARPRSDISPPIQSWQKGHSMNLPGAIPSFLRG
jgi:hypothetical protein